MRHRPRLLLFARTKTQADFDSRDFYHQDVLHLKEIGFDVTIVRSLRDRNLLRSYDVVFVWWFTLLPLMAAYATVQRARCVAFGNGHAGSGAAGDLSGRGIRQRFTRIGIGLSDAVAVPSEAEAVTLVEHGLARSEPFVIPHCVRLGGHRSTGFDMDTTAPLPGVFESDRVISMVFAATAGNIGRKRVADSVAAFDRVAEGNPDVRLVIAGQRGEGSAQLESIVAEADYGDRILMLGELSEPEKWSLLGRSEVFLALSLWEGFGLAIAEARTAGVKTVASPVPAVLEHLGGDGFYPEDESVQSTANALIEALDAEPLGPPALDTCERKRHQLREFLDVRSPGEST